MPRHQAAVTCPACGKANQLGVVFCTGCGKHLPAQGLTLQDVQRIRVRNRIRKRRRRQLETVVFLLIVFLAVLAFWPRSEPIGDRGSDAGAERLTRQLQALARLRDLGVDAMADHIGQSFHEADVNAFLQAIGHHGISVRIADGGLHVRRRFIWWRPDFLSPEQWPIMNVDAWYVIEGNNVRPARAGVGKLPLPVRLGRRIFDDVAFRLDGVREWRQVKPMLVESIEDGKISIILAPRNDD